MKKALVTIGLMAITACSGISSTPMPTSDVVGHDIRPNTSSYVYVGVNTEDGVHQDMALKAYPAGVDTSTPTYSRAYAALRDDGGQGLVSTATDSSGHVYVAQITPGSHFYDDIDERTANLSTRIRTITIENPEYITVDPSDNLWIYQGVYGGGGVIYEYNSMGTEQQHFNSPSNGGKPCYQGASSIAVDSADNVFLNCQWQPSFSSGTESTIYEYPASGSGWSSLFILNTQYTVPSYGIAYSPPTGLGAALLYLQGTSSSSLISNVTGYTTSGTAGSMRAVPGSGLHESIDGSGVLYLDTGSDGTVLEVSTPLSPSSTLHTITMSHGSIIAAPTGGASAH